MTTVLIVDDDRENPEHVRELLSDEGYEVRLASNGREALDAVAHALPDVILLDLVECR